MIVVGYTMETEYTRKQNVGQWRIQSICEIELEVPQWMHREKKDFDKIREMHEGMKARHSE